MMLQNSNYSFGNRYLEGVFTMENSKKILCLTLCIALMIMLFGCNEKSEVVTTISSEIVVDAVDDVLVDENGHIQTVQQAEISKTLDVGFGFYHLSMSEGISTDFEDIYSSSYANTTIQAFNKDDSFLKTMQFLVKNNGQVFIPAQPLTISSGGKLQTNWKENLEDCVKWLKDNNFYDNFAGWYFDEPYGPNGVNPAALKEVGKYNLENIKKRFFVMWSTVHIDKSIWCPPEHVNTAEVDKEIGKYLTDTGYSYYGDIQVNIGKYMKVRKELEKKLGQEFEHIKIWHVPCIFNFQGTFTEDKAIRHLRKMYEFLQNEKNPGGLICYTFNGGDVLEGKLSFSQYIQKDGEDYWERLLSETRRIGRLVVTNQFKDSLVVSSDVSSESQSSEAKLNNDGLPILN